MKFFPRERQFWLYHGAAMGFIAAVTLLSILLFGRLDGLNLANTLAWMPPYTLAVLGFRWLYLRRGWAALVMGRLIPIVIGYSLLSGVAVIAVVAAMVMPFFWAQISGGRADFKTGDFLLRNILSNGLQAQLFISAWAFVYISAAAAQRAREGELQNLRLQMSLKAAQLSSLTNQLKPHFLFNALNNIRFMIHEDGGRADAMIVALSELLRYSLESSQQSKTRLSQELAIIEAYVAIMRTQMEDRLDFRHSVPPALLGCLLPPMVVQLLVENAIKHGLDHLPQGGTLSVEAIDAGDSLLLRVGNDAPLNAATSPPGLGLGLANIERRLHLLYGERAALTVMATAGHFQVELSLPKEFSR
ncbi:sensor histidine kinase [Roseateles oligotrophus]|uniref:Histidine kinase n=1 Tax=Roseateles oligotrophus TaxID=1769250 RepID=A0ABT2YF36_9BURK|nr:histidine kinase [Roseateles oligotrophus]MCV2368634.1 histidine kinase [Roseateles oligotrophus]